MDGRMRQECRLCAGVRRVAAIGSLCSSVNHRHGEGHVGSHLPGVTWKPRAPRSSRKCGRRSPTARGTVLQENSSYAVWRRPTQILDRAVRQDRVKLAIAQGKTLEQLKALGPTLEYDGLYSRPGWTGDMFVEAIYRELSKVPSTPSSKSGPVKARPR